MTLPNEQNNKDAPLEAEGWEEDGIGKNVHSVYTHCIACNGWGVNMPLDKKCGNCGNSVDTLTYYDAETITILLSQTRKEAREAERKRVREYVKENRHKVERTDRYVLDDLLSKLEDKK